MTDPRRLIDDDDELSKAERGALAAARAERPGAAFVAGTWAELLAKIPPLGPLGPAHSSGGPTAPSSEAPSGAIATSSFGAATTAGVGTIAVIKAAAIGATLGALTLTGRAVVTRVPTAGPLVTHASHEAVGHEAARSLPPTPDPQNTGAATVAPSSNGREGAMSPALETPPSAADRGSETESSVANAAPRSAVNGAEKRREISGNAGDRRDQAAADDSFPPSGTSTSALAPASTSEDVRAETHLVAAAREALRAGSWAAASDLLEQARLRFPQGVLRQEREALGIEALVQSGQRRLAIERAEIFFRSYPQSPHSARVQALIASP